MFFGLHFWIVELYTFLKIYFKYQPLIEYACPHGHSLYPCPALCDPMNCSPLGSSFHEILQSRILGWVSMSSSRGSFWPRDQIHTPCVSWISGRVFMAESQGRFIIEYIICKYLHSYSMLPFCFLDSFLHSVKSF